MSELRSDHRNKLFEGPENILNRGTNKCESPETGKGLVSLRNKQRGERAAAEKAGRGGKAGGFRSRLGV